jgi:CBS domain containing-hemolysin-like protein
MLEINARLNFSLMFLIYRSGFTRIPVYESYRTNVVGILFVKVRDARNVTRSGVRSRASATRRRIVLTSCGFG